MLGRSRGGLGTKIHLLADQHGRPRRVRLTGGERNDCTQALALLGRLRPAAVIADKAYDMNFILEHLHQHRIEAVIPPSRRRTVLRAFDQQLYRTRNRIERTFAHLKQFRRLSTRFDKLHDTFLATVHLACCWRWLQYVDTLG